MVSNNRCLSCISTYGCLNCDDCKWNKYNPGIEDKYQLGQLLLDNNEVLKPNTLEINIPEGIDSIVINFKNKNNQQNTTHYSHIPEESDIGYNTYSCDNCGHHYCVCGGFDIPNYCENCGYKIEV